MKCCQYLIVRLKEVMRYYNSLFLVCASVFLVAMDNDKKNNIELRLVMSVDNELIKVPLNDELETISTFIARYNQNECHPFGKVMTYALNGEKVCEVGKIARLNSDVLVSLPRKKMLFVSYKSNQGTDTIHMIFAGTSAIRDVNILRKFIEGDQIPTKETPIKSDEALDAELKKYFGQFNSYEEFSRSAATYGRKTPWS